MRSSVFNGSFYPNDGAKLQEFIKTSLKEAKVPKTVKGALSYVAPHAGYVYSGKIAAFTYRAIEQNAKIENIDTIIVVGPNHTGMGRPIAVSMQDWQTPLGVAVNDRELSKAIVKESKYIWQDEQAHKNEHSIEVQLPFIKYILPDKKLVFLCMGDQGMPASEILSKSITNAAASLGREIMVVASSDLTHYEPLEIAKKMDLKVLDAIRNLDYKSFNEAIIDNNHTACGYGPISVAMLFSKQMGARKGLMLRYGSSAEATGDYTSVVTYPSMAFI